MQRGILEVFLVDAHGITHTNFIGDYRLYKKDELSSNFVYLNIRRSNTYLVAGSPVYYVLLQCGVKEYRSKMSKGSSFVIDIVFLVHPYMCLCTKLNSKRYLRFFYGSR